MKVVVKRCHFGSTHSDGSLDYNVYCDEERKVDVKGASKHLMRAEIVSESNINAFSTSISSVIHGEVSCIMKSMYYDHIFGCDKIQTDIILAEIGDEWTYIGFNSYGSYPMLIKRKDIDFKDLTTFTDKSRAFALWDMTMQSWYSPSSSDSFDGVEFSYRSRIN